MIKVLSRLFVVLCLVCAPGLASAQTASPQDQIAAIIAQFPDGGQPLADAIAAAVEANPSLASAVTQAAIAATSPAVQTALGGGLAEAAVFFANSSSPDAKAAQEQIQAAIAAAPAATLSAFNAGGGAAALLASLGSGGTTLTTSNCVSPSRPGNGC
jgi:hypothetical protein